MSNTNTGGPAFPVGEEALMRNLQGMTLRDYFAVHEPIDPTDSIGRLLAEKLVGRPYPGADDLLELALWWADAEAAYRYMRADAMLRAREAA